MANHSLFFIPVILAFKSCVSRQPAGSAGITQVIENRHIQYHPADTALSKPLWDYSQKLWYQDSLAIEEVRYIKIATDSKNNTVKEYPIMNFRFNDLRKRTVYEYQNLSDTAKLIRKYSFDDTSIQMTGGWNFKHIRNWGHNGPATHLPDTIIDNVIYNRKSFFRGDEKFPYIMICYFRCDKKETIFTLDPFISKEIGCPLVKMYHYSPINKGMHIFSEVKIFANKFTPEEQKVFDTWKKYAEDNPV